jgi:hypothetical protein
MLFLKMLKILPNHGPNEFIKIYCRQKINEPTPPLMRT